MKYMLIIAGWVVFFTAGATIAQERPSASGKTPDTWATESGVECSDLEYRDAVTSKFPEIARACRRVVRSAAGSLYVKVNAVILNVRRSTRDRSVTRVTLNMLDENGSSLRKISFRPPRGFRYTVDGEEKTADYMTKGEKLGVYLPPDRWEIAWSLETATPLDTQVYIEDIDTHLVTSYLQADDAFAFNSADLSAEGQAELDGIVTLIGNYVPAITIFGHTDRIGNEKYNQGLSQKRADSARDYLVSIGVPSGRVMAIGRGENNPIVVCEDLSGDALKDCLLPNRRVEVVFLIPAIADVATVEMTKTYLKPSGKIIQVTEELAVVKIDDISGAAGEFMDACADEIEKYCASTPAGDGRILGCLAANKQAGYEYSVGCDVELVRFVDAVLFRRTRLNSVGSECSAEIAACDAAPMGSKLDCVSSRPMSLSCSSAMSNLSSAAF